MRTLTVSATAAALLLLAACSSPKNTAAPAPSPAAPAQSSAAPVQTTAAAGKLTLDVVKSQVQPVFAKDPDCPKGEWVTDPANIDAKYRANVTAFGEYDCHLADGEMIPHRVAQAVYLTFRDSHTMNDYVDNELGIIPSLVDGTTVVVIGSGLKTVPTRPMLRSISQACVCGHVT
ncbi:hypothetical protein [Dactylosporangium sp. NPDC049140]|jgi:hypothetical protein|uniref:hypothetical protein n=1 Tax=Dactylosporangium sp. NPDC049140 TaxID=3155647 RepID=UPI00340AFF00